MSAITLLGFILFLLMIVFGGTKGLISIFNLILKFYHFIDKYRLYYVGYTDIRGTRHFLYRSCFMQFIHFK